MVTVTFRWLMNSLTVFVSLPTPPRGYPKTSYVVSPFGRGCKYFTEVFRISQRFHIIPPDQISFWLVALPQVLSKMSSDVLICINSS